MKKTQRVNHICNINIGKKYTNAKQFLQIYKKITIQKMNKILVYTLQKKNFHDKKDKKKKNTFNHFFFAS